MQIVPALLFPFLTCWVQWQFWSIFKPFVWFLFYPTVFFSSRIGGKTVGLVSSAISALLVVYFFIPPQLSFTGKNIDNLYSVAIFLLMGVLFSYTHDRLERAKLRTVEAQEASRIANLQLQEARIGRLQAEQKLTQDQLQRSESRFKSIFTNSPIAIGIGRSDDGRIIEVNDAWLQLYGFERDEVIGRTTAELNLYLRADQRAELVDIINERGHILNSEIQLRRKDGEIIVAQYSAEIIKLGEESFLQVMMTDITEQKRMETELRRSEEMYRSLFCNMMNGFAYCRMLFDGETPLDFIYLSVNDAFEKLTGLKDVVGRRVSEVIPGIRETDPGVIEAYGRVALSGEPERFEVYLETLQEWFWISAYSPARGFFVAVFDVITERKLAEQALQEKNTELERFTYMISHDLKSPLVTVKTFLGYLEQDLATSDTGRIGKDLDFIRSAADRMGRMLDELLELSRIGRMVNAPQTSTMRELAQSARNMVAGRIAEGGVEVLVEDRDVALYGDCPRLQEIWQNLVENACKFMGDQAHPTIRIGAETGNGETIFFVCDNGVGIEPEYRDKVFGLFEKLDRNSEGTGLGLALVKRIVELHGGKIWIESQGGGRGACFRFTLPAAVQEKGEK
jgi:PAS domain S-box-containing protein